LRRDIALHDSLKSSLDVQIEKEIHGVSIFGKTINQVLEEAGQNIRID
jgi:hypothetical protein